MNLTAATVVVVVRAWCTALLRLLLFGFFNLHGIYFGVVEQPVHCALGIVVLNLS